jgi:cytochrome P450
MFGFEARQLERRRKLVKRSGLFDADWYARTYHDVGPSGFDPLTHYVKFGAIELRAPGPAFDSVAYLDANPDVEARGADPLVHFQEFGRAEKRPAIPVGPSGPREPAAFIPTRPLRPSRALDPLTRVGLLTGNLIAGFEESSYHLDFIKTGFLGRKAFLCNSPESVQFAFSTHNGSFERKTPEMRYVLKPLVGDGLFISDGPIWRKRRRIVSPIVHVSRLPEFAPVMVDAALETRQAWRQMGDGASLDVLSEMGRLTAEIICRTVFGLVLGRENSLAIVEGFGRFQKVASCIDMLTLLGVSERVPRWHAPAVRRESRALIDLVDQIVEKVRSKKTSGGSSMVQRLIDSVDQETGMPLDPVATRNEAVVLFMAGYETTANSLAWVWYLLSRAPEVEARLHAEIDEVLGGRAPSLADVPKLIYTRAVFEETLRLYPPIPSLSRQALTDEEFNGCKIPAGSRVMVIPWLLHRHRKLWDKPDHFMPERFLPGGHEPRSKFAYVPFSIGPRICPGLGFGLTEAVLCIATLAQAFKLRLHPGQQVETFCRITLRPGESLPMRLEYRTGAETGEDAPHPVPTPAVPAPQCPYHHA